MKSPNFRNKISTMKTKLFSLRFDVYCLVSFAQQDAQFIQYIQHININPAYAGSRGALSVFYYINSMGWFRWCTSYKCASVNTPLTIVS
jgi:hypothetical protein